MNYNSRVEEARSIKRRTRRDQVRLMLLIKEADQAGRLEQFANDIDMTVAGAGNYVAAYDRYVEDQILPRYITDADEVKVGEIVYEMWNDVFDATLDGRFGYGKVDNEGVEAAADEMGLKGYTKAKDIAKNPKSMQAAILGDERASTAALEAMSTLAQRDTGFRLAAEKKGFFFADPERHGDHGDARPRLSFWARRILTLRELTASTRERAFQDDEVPYGLYDACIDGVENLSAAASLIKGRFEMDRLDRMGEVRDAS